jgi:hypothetical protein
MMMKVTPDDPRLSAYLLGELSPEEAAVIKRAAAADPAIKMSLSELEKTFRFLGSVLGRAGNEMLLPAQREAIRQAGRDADSLGKVVELASAKRSWRPWLAGLGAAAAVAFAALLMSRVEPNKSGEVVDSGMVTDEIALLPMPGPSAGEGSTNVGSRGGPEEEQARSLESRPGGFLSDVARHLDRRSLPEKENLPMTGAQSGFTSDSQARLPVVVGTSSLRWVTGWIREKQQLPPRNAVRVEELINNAALPSGVQFEGLSLSIESMRCPWNSESMLVGVQIKAGPADARDLKVVYESERARRLLGSFVVRENRDLPSLLPANRRTLVVLEVMDSASELGAVRISLGAVSSKFDVPGVQDGVTSGMRHASLLAGFGMWLRGEGVTSNQVDAMLLDAKADADPVRAELRRMMSEALKLADSER